MNYLPSSNRSDWALGDVSARSGIRRSTPLQTPPAGMEFAVVAGDEADKLLVAAGHKLAEQGCQIREQIMHAVTGNGHHHDEPAATAAEAASSVESVDDVKAEAWHARSPIRDCLQALAARCWWHTVFRPGRRSHCWRRHQASASWPKPSWRRRRIWHPTKCSVTRRTPRRRRTQLRNRPDVLPIREEVGGRQRAVGSKGRFHVRLLLRLLLLFPLPSAYCPLPTFSSRARDKNSTGSFVLPSIAKSATPRPAWE